MAAAALRFPITNKQKPRTFGSDIWLSAQRAATQTHGGRSCLSVLNAKETPLA